MASRFLILASRFPRQEVSPQLRARIARLEPELAFLRDAPGHLVLGETPQPDLLSTERGIILGTVHASGHKEALAALDEPSQAYLQTSGGRHLVDAYWGRYVALIRSPERQAIHIVRAPLGDLPCYFVVADDLIALASDIALLMATGLVRPTVDWSALARQLIAGDMRRDETCLTGVRELQGGDRLTIGSEGLHVERLWTPWTFVTRPIPDPTEAVRRLRDTICACVAAQASVRRHVLLKLSGGLDSSIVAAALKRSGVPFTCLNLVTDAATGDERCYARRVANHLGVPIIETYRRPDMVDPLRSAASHLPRPSERSFVQETQRACAKASRDTGADAVFEGGGGDNVFCSLQSVAPVADCLLADDRQARFWRMARDMARLAETSTFTVAAHAVRRLWRRSRGYRWASDLRFLSDDARDEAPAAIAHPWLEAPSDALPGRAAHIALIVAAQSYVEGLDPQADPPTIAPLLAQPVVELCLSIPSWLWFEDGHNRAIARRAFAETLPDEIAWRRSKGTPESFMAELYERHRPALRDALLGGLLARHGLLDRPALARELYDPRPVVGTAFLRILQLADAEAWARSWDGAGADGSRPTERRVSA